MIHFRIPFFPPTTNHAFFVRNGRLHLSNEGKTFKENVKAHIVQNYAPQTRTFKRNVPYLMYLRLHFVGGLENKGWPSKCQTRYVKIDATNRVKLIEDAIRDALGVDDSQFLAVMVEKHGPTFPQEGKSEDYVEALFWDLEKERSPLDAFQRL